MKNNYETIRQARRAIQRERAERRLRVAQANLRIVARAGITRVTTVTGDNER
jgi:hypothetical protein